MSNKFTFENLDGHRWVVDDAELLSLAIYLYDDAEEEAAGITRRPTDGVTALAYITAYQQSYTLVAVNEA